MSRSQCFIVIVAVFTVCLAIERCSRSSTPVTALTGQLIKKPGQYKLQGTGYRLDISIAGKSIVQYSLVDASTNQALVADNCGSDAHRWYLCIDDSDRLWVYSSDIGGCVWVTSANGSYEKHSFDPKAFKEWVPHMPKEYVAELPNSIKRSMTGEP